MIKSIILTISILSIAACNDAGPKTRSDESASPEPIMEAAVEKICYAFDQDNDLIGLTLEIQGDQIRGDLAYAVDGLDRTSGTIKGKMTGDTLFAEYAYMHNGRRIIREIAFLRNDNMLLEAYGDFIERDGRMEYRHRNALKFSNNFPLRKVLCERPQ